MIEHELRPMEAVADVATAVDRLVELHAGATQALRTALTRYLDGGPPPDAAERLQFRYPELRVTYRPGRPGAADQPRHRQDAGARHLQPPR